MSYQYEMGPTEETASSQRFSQVIKRSAAELPAPPDDPYTSKHPLLQQGINKHIDYRTQYYENGEISFSMDDEVRRMYLGGDMELIFVRTGNQSELIVHQFSGQGLAARTTFQETPEGIQKHRQAGAYTLFDVLNNPNAEVFYRYLDEEEATALIDVLDLAIAGSREGQLFEKEALKELLRTSDAEAAMIASNQQKTAQSKEVFRQNMQEAVRRSTLPLPPDNFLHNQTQL